MVNGYDTTLFDRTSCSRKDKEEFIPIINQLIELSEKSRREGLLSLESGLDENKIPFLIKGLNMIIDGTDPEIVSSILLTIIYSSHITGKELLRMMIMREGILSIQKGDNPGLTKEKLRSYLGLDWDLIS